MNLPFLKKKPDRKAIAALYTAIVAQSRQPIFYAQWNLPDTVTGRFDMISLHMALVFRRLRREEARTIPFAQGLFDYFFKDMDRSLRELGAGDMAVPKKIEKMGSLFFGLLTALNAALDGDDPAALPSMLRRNVLQAGTDEDLARLGAYVRDQDGALTALGVDAIMAGQTGPLLP